MKTSSSIFRTTTIVNIFGTFFTLCLVLLCLASCQKEKLDFTDELVNDNYSTKNAETNQKGNRIHICTAIMKNELLKEDKATSRAVGRHGKYWNTGKTLKVKFLNGSSFVKGKVKQYAREWEKYANIKFQFVESGNSDIRIGFEWDGDQGSWSYFGTDALGISSNKPTMNFGWFNSSTSNEGFRRTTLHEFGHALGLDHEHQHPLGGIQWDKEEIYESYMGEPNNWTRENIDFQLFRSLKENKTNYTNYDAKSIMHYPIPQEHTLNNYSVGLNDNLSEQDKQFMEMIYPYATDWSSGWSTSEHFKINGQLYSFLLKARDGNVHIQKVKSNGMPGHKVYDSEERWSSGWTTAEFYEVNGATYLFLLKESNGNVHIHKMKNDGTLGTMVYDSQSKWSSGWSTAEFHEINGVTYLFLLKEKNGDVHIHKMKNDGTPGTMVYDSDERWSNGWTTAEFYEVNGVTYLFLLKESNGNVHIHKMKNDGTLGTMVYDSQSKWTSGWSSAEFYEINGQPHVMLLKRKSGHIHIQKINSNGLLGKKIYDNNGELSNDWTTASSYQVNNQNYMMLIKEKNGNVHRYKMR